MRVDIDFLTGGIRYERPYDVVAPVAESATTNQRDQSAKDAERPKPSYLRPSEAVPLGQILRRVLAHRDVCSRKPIYERYDSVVRGTTSMPCGYADAGVIVPIPGAPLGIALSVDGNPRYALVDARRAAELAVLEAVRNVAAVGATPAALTDCLNYGNPEIRAQMGEFVAGVDGIAHAARELGTPFVSGNVSLYNTSANGSAIPASPIIACVGTIADISRTATHRLKGAKHPLFFLGLAQTALGGSVYAELRGIADDLPQTNYEHARRELKLLALAYERDLIAAAHDVSDGGLLVAVAEMAFASLGPRGAIGAKLEDTCLWTGGHTSHEIDYFAEYGGFVIEAYEARDLVQLARECDVTLRRIGMTTADASIVTVDAGGTRHDLHELYEAWSAPLRDFYGDAV
jgi:phosphoribosylformylglycinamidine synthase